MILVDVNILLYAEDLASPHHAIIQPWWDALLSGHEQVALSWQSINGFLRIATNTKVMAHAMTSMDACNKVTRWLSQPNVCILTPGSRHWSVYQKLIHATSAAGNLLMDAHLAALAIEHHCELASCDVDFAKFPGLLWINPLAS